MTNRALAHSEALHLLGGVALGRIAFTVDALPTILPANHIVDQGDIIVRGHRGMDALLKAAAGNVVAYSADVIDQRTYVGWTVTLTGLAEMVDDPEKLARYPEIIRSWGTHEENYAIRIVPGVMVGFELLQRSDDSFTGAS
jgi:Pyridoxamine 5'-phosphate oxidase